MKNYKKTLLACYLGFITQAIAANFTPLLFLTFHINYKIPLGSVALISSVFFLTQLVVDVLCTKLVDRIGYRRCIVASEVLSAMGLIGLAFLPERLPDPFIGILISVVIYAIGSGLIEVLCSPIVEACPFENKEAAMSLLHSFYCWGSVGVVLISTLIFAIFGIENWKWVACFWALVPIYNIYNFAVCPIERLAEEGTETPIRELLAMPLFWVAIVLMVCSGASELSMSQWASAFVESALGLPKTVGDLLGPCLFAVTMGISRVIFGRFGAKMNLVSFMIGSGVMCLCCYLLAALVPHPIVGLLGCIFCGASVGIMWPGTISISARAIPKGSTALFALLAMAGDLGGATGPWLVGIVTQQAGDELRKGVLAGTIFPIVLVMTLIGFAITKERKEA